jgi:hypothetical protein
VTISVKAKRFNKECALLTIWAAETGSYGKLVKQAIRASIVVMELLLFTLLGVDAKTQGSVCPEAGPYNKGTLNSACAIAGSE